MKGFKNPRLVLLALARKSFNNPKIPAAVGLAQLVPDTPGKGNPHWTITKSTASAAMSGNPRPVELKCTVDGMFPDAFVKYAAVASVCHDGRFHRLLNPPEDNPATVSAVVALPKIVLIKSTQK